MRRDRLIIAATLTAIFSADLYFILIPKLRNTFSHGSGQLCSCPDNNITLPKLQGLAQPMLSNWTASTHLETTTYKDEEKDVGSKLERLFAHPLYNIQAPALDEERLLEVEQLMDYYQKKVSRWERLVLKMQSTVNEVKLGVKNVVVFKD